MQKFLRLYACAIFLRFTYSTYIFTYLHNLIQIKINVQCAENLGGIQIDVTSTVKKKKSNSVRVKSDKNEVNKILIYTVVNWLFTSAIYK